MSCGDTIKPIPVRKALSLVQCLVSAQSILAIIMTSEPHRRHDTQSFFADDRTLGRAGAGHWYFLYINRRCLQTEAEILREENGDKELCKQVLATAGGEGRKTVPGQEVSAHCWWPAAG